MKEIILQRKGAVFYPFDPESAELMMEYHENQPVRSKTTGIKRPRSYRQLKAYWKSCEIVAENSEQFTDKYDADWETRVQLKHIGRMTVQGNKVMVEVESISYSRLGHVEANRYFDRAFELHAKWLNISKEELLTQTKEAGND